MEIYFENLIRKKHSGVGGTEIFSLNAPRRLLTPVLLSLTLLAGIRISVGHILVSTSVPIFAHIFACPSSQMFSSMKSPFPHENLRRKPQSSF